MRKLPEIEILDEKEKILHTVSKEVVFPISEKDKQKLKDMVTYLELSQDDKYIEKYDLRAGMGLALVQTGDARRAFVIANENEDKSFTEFIIINPKIISQSEEMVYVGEGEGCLSVNRDIPGIVPRYARVTFTGFDIEGNPVKYRAREELAIAFQHELDHLNGIMFYDHIDPLDPYKNKDYMREI